MKEDSTSDDTAALSSLRLTPDQHTDRAPHSHSMAIPASSLQPVGMSNQGQQGGPWLWFVSWSWCSECLSSRDAETPTWHSLGGFCCVLRGLRPSHVQGATGAGEVTAVSISPPW